MQRIEQAKETRELPMARLLLAAAVAAALLSGRPAFGRRAPSARPGGPDGRDAPAISMRSVSPRSGGSVAGPPGGKAATVPLERRRSQRQGRSSSDQGYYFVVDNHSIDPDMPNVPGPGAPANPQKIIVLGPGPNSPLMLIMGGLSYYLPFSTDLFPKDTIHPASAVDGYGIAQVYGGRPSDGTTPQSSLPLGVPVAPAPSFDVAVWRQAALRLVSLLDTPEADADPAGRAVKASIHNRDVQISLKNLPGRSDAAPGTQPKRSG